MRPRSRRLALSLALLAFVSSARADDPKPAPARPDHGKPAAKAKEPEAQAYKGPEIEWARSCAEAREEAAERNVAMFLHSHGST